MLEYLLVWQGEETHCTTRTRMVQNDQVTLLGFFNFLVVIGTDKKRALKYEII